MTGCAVVKRRQRLALVHLRYKGGFFFGDRLVREPPAAKLSRRNRGWRRQACKIRVLLVILFNMLTLNPSLPNSIRIPAHILPTSDAAQDLQCHPQPPLQRHRAEQREK